MSWVLANIWPLGFLTIAVCDDLLFKKFHNFLFLGLSAIAIVALLWNGSPTWLEGIQGFFLSAVLFLPLVLLGVTGAGDMKFMMAFGLVVGPSAIFWVSFYSLFWGGLMGLLKILLSGESRKILTKFSNFSTNTFLESSGTKVPYTVALLLGWLTWSQAGGIL